MDRGKEGNLRAILMVSDLSMIDSQSLIKVDWLSRLSRLPYWSDKTQTNSTVPKQRRKPGELGK